MIHFSQVIRCILCRPIVREGSGVPRDVAVAGAVASEDSSADDAEFFPVPCHQQESSPKHQRSQHEV
jgi:hypothetical protein